MLNEERTVVPVPRVLCWKSFVPKSNWYPSVRKGIHLNTGDPFPSKLPTHNYHFSRLLRTEPSVLSTVADGITSSLECIIVLWKYSGRRYHFVHHVTLRISREATRRWRILDQSINLSSCRQHILDFAQRYMYVHSHQIAMPIWMWQMHQQTRQTSMAITRIFDLFTKLFYKKNIVDWHKLWYL